MEKQELIHLHGLLAEVKSNYEERTGNRVESEEYLSHGVRPTSIHKSKTDHKKSIFALAESITSEIEDPGSTEFDLDDYYEDLLSDAQQSGRPIDGKYHLRLRETSLNTMELRELDEAEDYPVEFSRFDEYVEVPEEEIEIFEDGIV